MNLTMDEMKCVVCGLRELGIRYSNDAFGDFKNEYAQKIDFINNLTEKFRKEIEDETQRSRSQ